jgi:hypothetical protein
MQFYTESIILVSNVQFNFEHKPLSILLLAGMLIYSAGN